MNFRRVFTLLKKELIQTRRDRRMMGMLIIAPIIQLFLFGYAVSTDVNNITMAVLDQDKTHTSRKLIETFVSSGYFEYRQTLDNPAQINETIDSGSAQFAITIPLGFEKDTARGRSVHIQTVLDGSDSTNAKIVNGYVNGALAKYWSTVTSLMVLNAGFAKPQVPSVEVVPRVWYNPELKSVNFMVPGVLCQILMLITMMMTALAIVKEKEIGTLEQVIVTPISSAELMLGKTIPFLLIGLLDTVLVVAVAIGWFGVAVAGSYLLLFAVSILFLLTTLGLGIFVSTVSKNQHEATMTSFFFFMPSILLSGMMYPIENMPKVVQYLTLFIPLRYAIEAVRGIFLKGIGIEYLWPQMLILAIFGIGIIALSAMRFSKKMG